MKDNWGRKIDYLRLSLTDRCNLHCRYCRPETIPYIPHEQILRYEELLQICQAAVSLGITCFKITGGEPLVRKGTCSFIRALKSLEGTSSVTLTTNGQFLPDALPELRQAGIDGINISLDSLNAVQYRQLTGGNLDIVLQALHQTVESGINVKVNAVLLNETKNQLLPLASLAQKFPIAVRFIEVMPIGYGNSFQGQKADDVLSLLQTVYPDLQPSVRHYGNGPAVYYESQTLKGPVGFIAANSHRFCQTCNRLRLTSTGFLKPCLCYDDGIDLRTIIRQGGAVIPALQAGIRQAVSRKRAHHSFAAKTKITERRTMNQIGG